VVVAVLMVLLALGITALSRVRDRANSTHCINFLMQIGEASRIWVQDHQDKYPMDVSVLQGGVKELLATGNVAACFEVMSNELATPTILVCPNDPQHQAAPDWNGQLSRSNISYFIGYVSTNDDSSETLSGDANLIKDGLAVPSGPLNLGSALVTWTAERHHGVGHILLSDGSVRQSQQMGMGSATVADQVTNQIVIP